MTRFIAALSLWLIGISCASAQIPLSGLSAGGAIANSDLFYDVQSVGVGGVKVTGAQLGTYIYGITGGVCTGNLSCKINLTVGNSTISSGIANGLLYDSSGVLQNNGPVVSAVSNPSANGQWSIGATVALGAIIIGQGSTDDFQLQNSAGTGVLSVATGALVPTFNGVTGSTQCLHVNSSGVLSGTGSDCSSGSGTPGGSNTQIQYNNSSVFGGIADWTTDGTVITGALGTITTNKDALTITGTWNASGVTFDAPLFMNITNTASAANSFLLDIQLGGANLVTVTPGRSTDGQGLFRVWSNGAFAAQAISIGSNAASPMGFYTFSSNQALAIGQQNNNVNVAILAANHEALRIDGRTVAGFTANSSVDSSGSDTAWFRDAAVGTFAIADSTTAAALRVYNTTDQNGTGTAPTNYERGVADWTTTASTFTVGTQKNGTGSARNLRLTTTRHIDIAGGTPTANSCAGFALATGSSDGTGNVSFNSATSCSITFGSAYTNAPFCNITPGSAASTVEVVTTTGGFTATFGTAQTALTYQCFGA